MGFDVGCIQHQCLKTGILLCQRIENLLENACLGPAFIPVVKGLGGLVSGRNIAPETAALQAENDAGQHPAAINCEAHLAACWAVMAWFC